MLIDVYVASPDPDPNPNPRGRGQLPNPNEWNSTLTSATREEMLTPIQIAKGGWRTGDVRIATA